MKHWCDWIFCASRYITDQKQGANSPRMWSSQIPTKSPRERLNGAPGGLKNKKTQSEEVEELHSTSRWTRCGCGVKMCLTTSIQRSGGSKTRTRGSPATWNSHTCVNVAACNRQLREVLGGHAGVWRVKLLFFSVTFLQLRQLHFYFGLGKLYLNNL